MTKKVLLVDDDENVLSGFRRQLRKEFELQTALGGEAALKILEEEGPFAVVVSDMQMPGMSGIDLLARVREANEHTVRVMLTGNADQKTAVDAVNDGQIFRFLNKPCPPHLLAETLRAGIEQYRLVTAEAELLNKTLSGSVCMLTQVLSLALPDAFGRTQEVRGWAKHIAQELKVENVWQVEIAAMLMRLGCVSLPRDVLENYLAGKGLSETEAELVDETPKLAFDLLSSIPRLEQVAEFVRDQNEPPRETTPLESRILRVVGDFQIFRTKDTDTAYRKLGDVTKYDQDVVKVLKAGLTVSRENVKVKLKNLRPGMVLDNPIVDKSDRLLVAGGVEVHQALIQKLLMLQKTCGVKQPIEVQEEKVNAEVGSASAIAEGSDAIDLIEIGV